MALTMGAWVRLTELSTLSFAKDTPQSRLRVITHALVMSRVKRAGGTGGGGISSRMAEHLQSASGLLLTRFETRYGQALGRLH